MGKGNTRHIGNIGSFGLLNDFLCRCLLFVFDMCKIRSIQFGCFILYLFGIYSFFGWQHAVPDQTKETSSSSSDVISGIVGILKTSPTELVVQLRESRPFELPALSSRNRTKIRRNVLGIQRPAVQQIGSFLLAEKFRPRDFDIKINIMASEVPGSRYIFLKSP